MTTCSRESYAPLCNLRELAPLSSMIRVAKTHVFAIVTPINRTPRLVPLESAQLRNHGVYLRVMKSDWRRRHDATR